MPIKDIVKIFKGLADQTRLRITLLLLERELCVCELMTILGMEQSLISHHLRILREAGIAEDVRDGRWIIYRVPKESRELLKGLFAGPLRDRIGLTREASEDAKKLEACVDESARSRGEKSRPRLEER